MRLIILTEAYFPRLNSASVQMNDLVSGITSLDIKCSVLYWSSSSNELEDSKNTKHLKLKINTWHKHSNIIRFFAELFYSVASYFKFYGDSNKYNGIIVYSPTIFLSITAFFLKIKYRCKVYLILRDIFPQWLIDLGLIHENSLIEKLLRMFETFQFKVADKIGIQSIGNSSFITQKVSQGKVEIFENWINIKSNTNQNLININLTKRYIYSGNIGVAQSIFDILDLARSVKYLDYEFIIIGAGSEYKKLKAIIDTDGIYNLKILPNVSHENLVKIYHTCSAGIILLDHRHTTHNIPGKFISYISNGLPVFAVVNEKNDLIETINNNGIGLAISDREKIVENFEKFANNIAVTKDIGIKCIEFAKSRYCSIDRAKYLHTYFRGS